MLIYKFLSVKIATQTQQ